MLNVDGATDSERNIMKKTAFLIALAMAMATMNSMAQGRPQGGQGGQGGPGGRGGFRGGGGGQLMEALDLNKDGSLDAREIQSAPMSLRKLDKNKDFKLDPEELGTRRSGDMASRMMEMDKNKDGKITKDELPDERMGRFIDRMDTNGDGAVDQEEIQAMQRRFQEGGFGGRGGRGGGGPQGGQQGGGRPQTDF